MVVGVLVWGRGKTVWGIEGSQQGFESDALGDG